LQDHTGANATKHWNLDTITIAGYRTHLTRRKSAGVDNVLGILGIQLVRIGGKRRAGKCHETCGRKCQQGCDSFSGRDSPPVRADSRIPNGDTSFRNALIREGFAELHTQY
jgi:hypothetical protein